jgi:hypothetical protein
MGSGGMGKYDHETYLASSLVSVIKSVNNNDDQMNPFYLKYLPKNVAIFLTASVVSRDGLYVKPWAALGKS